MSNIEWEPLESTFGASDVAPNFATFRAKVTGGWRVVVDGAETFVPDPEHKWLRDEPDAPE